MESTDLIIWGFIFGTIGIGFFTYGKRQKSIIPFISGIGLFLIPYFISNLFLLIIAGLILIILPYFIRI
jgi:hypothetical protein